jgi:acetyl-CoA synthase
MSRIIATAAIKGAHKEVAEAERMLNETKEAVGATTNVEFPNTGFYLPIIYALSGIQVEKLDDMDKALDVAKDLLPPVPRQGHWLPYLGHTLDAGIATLFAGEVIEGCKYATDPPVDDVWLGAADDVIMRERGVEFVDGTAPGFCALVGLASSPDIADKIVVELLEKNLYVWMSGNIEGNTITEQLLEKDRQLGWDTRIVPYGKGMSSAVYSLGFAARAAMSFGGAQPGDFNKILRYNKNRIFAFVLALDYVDEQKYAYAAGAINYGFPAIANTNIPEILPTGVCTYEHVVSNVPEEEIVQKCVEVRGLKIQIAEIPIPMAYGPAFEGEVIRKADMYLQFGGNITPAFEYVKMRELDEVEDGKIEVVGPEIDDVEEGGALPLGIVVEVAGRKMQEDFESILERQIHHLINGSEGVWHMGQRDIVWTRISKKAQSKGFKIHHYGDIIHAKLINDFPSIVDKVQVTIYTEPDKVEEWEEVARKAYRYREDGGYDRRVGGYFLLLYPVPVLRPHPRVHHLPPEAGTLRRL